MVAEPDAASGLNRTLPSRNYYDSHIFEQEKERIFYDAWICAARTEESVVEAPGFEPCDTVGFLDRVLKQDYAICEEVQKAIRSRAHRQGVYLEHEHLPYKFNQWVLERLHADG